MSKARRTATEGWRNRLGVGALSVVALCLVVTAGVLFMRLLDNERQMDAIVREDAMWAVFQTDRHMRQFYNSALLMVAHDDARLLPELTQTYDILYSRVSLLERGTFLLDLAATRELSHKAQHITDFVFGLEERMDALSTSSPNLSGEVAALANEIAAYQLLTNELLLGANSAMNQMRVDERVLRAKMQDQLAILAVALVFAFIGIFTLLMLQLRRIAYSNQRMRLLQERSRRQAERAKAANKAKSAFLATMSHEIRTPLNGIIGSADLMALDDLPPQPAHKLGTIRASAVLLRDLINSILDFSSLESGAFERREVETDLQELAEALTAAFHAQAVERGLSLSFDFPVERILTNNIRLNQILINLVGNALKFTHEGGVRVTGKYDAGMLRVEVEDDGIGIAAAHQAQLFEKFTQVDGSFAREYGGSGLGLAICRQIVTAMGGRIGVRSELGVGSVFWFEIPVRTAPTQPAQAETTTRAADKISSKRILVIEDNPINADVVTGMLGHLGHSVATASNGAEGLKVLDKFIPDLVLMDMQMPVMDGTTATRKIRAQGYEFPIVALTANAFAQDRAACFAAGMTDFLSKPVTLHALEDMLARQVYQVNPSLGSERRDCEPEVLALRDTPEIEAASTQPSAPVAESASTAPRNQQMLDLMDALGNEMVLMLVKRFADELGSVEKSLSEALEAEDMSAVDDLLHTFKGAALTLGMERSGAAAQTLRTRRPMTASDLKQLVALAREDERLAYITLSKIEAA